MNGVQLLEILKRVTEDEYYQIIELVLDNKDVFDRPGLSPNAVDCIDRAVASARFLSVGSEESALYRLSSTYNSFLTTLGVVARANYWDSGSARETAPSVIKTNRQFKGRPQATEYTKNEVSILRQVFDTYVKAKLRQYGMSKYSEKLIRDLS